MDRASPVEMRKSLELVALMRQAGIRFVPVPVMDEADFQVKVGEVLKRLEEIESRCGDGS